jgi:hypothetical protein
MKRILLLAIVTTFATCSEAIAQCPGGVCPPRFSVRLYSTPPVVSVVERPAFYGAPIYSAPVLRYDPGTPGLPVYAAPPRVVYRIAPSFSYSRTSRGRSWSMGWGAFQYSQGSRCRNGRCR